MPDPTFTAGQRVYHPDLGCYGRWLNYEVTAGGDPRGYSRVEIEDSAERLRCPTRCLRPAEEDE